MTPRERLLTAYHHGKPDRLPATVHSWMKYYLDTRLDGVDQYEAYRRTGLDMVVYEAPYANQGGMFLENKGMMETSSWRVSRETRQIEPGRVGTRIRIETPEGVLTTATESNVYTTWISEPLIKEKEQIRLLRKFMPYPALDIARVNEIADAIGDQGVLRTHVYGYGQPGCWQDACCLYGTVNLIYMAHDDPAWVHEFLGVLMEKKLAWVAALRGARYDIMELGGGDASDTVISPSLFQEFVLPYDARIVRALHDVGLRCVYHTCGGMMGILDKIKSTGADGSETLTPPEMGGNADLREIKRVLGDSMFLQGGFDQFHGFVCCSREKTREMVFACFEKAGRGGGYVICPSDHFFEADIGNVEAFAEAARECTY